MSRKRDNAIPSLLDDRVVTSPRSARGTLFHSKPACLHPQTKNTPLRDHFVKEALRPATWTSVARAAPYTDFDRHKNVILIAANGGKMQMKGEERRRK